MKVVSLLGQASSQMHNGKVLNKMFGQEFLTTLYSIDPDYFDGNYGRYFYSQIIEGTVNNYVAKAIAECVNVASDHGILFKPATEVDYRNTDMENFHDRVMFIIQSLVTTLSAIRAQATTMAADQIGVVVTMMYHLGDDFDLNIDWHKALSVAI